MIEISKELNKTLQTAQSNAKQWGHEYLTVEHIFHALLSNQKIAKALRDCGGDVELIKTKINQYLRQNLQAFPGMEQIPTETIAVSRVIEMMIGHVKGSQRKEAGVGDLLAAILEEEKAYSVKILKALGITRLSILEYIADHQEIMNDQEKMQIQDEKRELYLEKYCTNLTQAAKQGKIDPIIGREEEITKCMEILLRRKKNNPLLVGEPGVGKTAIAEGLALIAKEKENPLYGVEIYSLNMASLIAGTKYRGDFEKRLKGITDEIMERENIILFIDEIHTLIGAGSTNGGSMDASNLLKPVLGGGKFRCVGASTYAEYRNFLDKDKAFSRRFAKIDVDEPSKQEACLILQGLRGHYEKFHNVSYSNEAIALAVELSSRYLHERYLPDKAIDILDQVGASYRLEGKSGKISLGAIKKMVAKMAKIPEIEATKDDKNILKHLEKQLRSRIFGQDVAIVEIVQAIKRSKAGLNAPSKPIGSFLFSGPSGVGKTQLAKELAHALGINFERIDMSEYMEKHTTSRLIGAPAGYVGYEQGGILTEMIKKNPHTLLLLDEIEKAHPDVLNIFLQVMDNAKLTDNNGTSSDFSSVILIMTSNVGSKESPALGFHQHNHSKFQSAIKENFSPEFRNRLDAIIAFNPLGMQEIIKVVDKNILDLNKQLEEKQVEVILKKSAKEYLSQKGFSAELGARPLNLVIQKEIKNKLSHEILFGALAKGGKIIFELKDGVLCFKCKAK